MVEERNPALDAALIAKAQAETDKLNFEILNLKRHRELEDNKDDPNRIYPFWGDVNSASSRACVDTLGRWSRMYPGEPFTIIFNSPGGGVLPGLALFDYLQEIKGRGHAITTVSIGYAASMGGVLLQAGTKRVMGKHAWLLIHEVGAGASGKQSEMEDEVKFYSRLQTQLLDILAERATFSPAQIKTRWKRKDWWLSAQEALDGGFIDEIQS